MHSICQRLVLPVYYVEQCGPRQRCSGLKMTHQLIGSYLVDPRASLAADKGVTDLTAAPSTT
jgi:hypothetical protein